MTTTTTTTSATRPYKFYQGTAMGQPSVIVVDNIRLCLQSTSGTDHDDHQHHHNINNSHTISEHDNTLNETNDILVPEQHIVIHDTDDEYNTNSYSSAELLSSTHAAGTMQQKEPRDRNPVNTNVMATIENCETTATTETSHTAMTTTDETGTSTSKNPTTSDSTPTDNNNKDYRYQYHRGTVSFTLLGRIEVDHTEIMEI
jgi:hypothetical protein